MIAKGARPPGSNPVRKGTLHNPNGVSSFNFDLNNLKLSSEVVIELRGNVAPYVHQAGDVARSLLGARIHR